MKQRIKFVIADLFNRSRRYCWADLVTWALDWHRWPGATAEAHRCNVGCGDCWCGKFQTESGVNDDPPF